MIDPTIWTISSFVEIVLEHDCNLIVYNHTGIPGTHMTTCHNVIFESKLFKNSKFYKFKTSSLKRFYTCGRKVPYPYEAIF